MTIELKLDTAALSALFPEGSEARVNLQQACTENFARRHFRGLGEDVLRRLDVFRAEALAEIESKYTTQKNGWGPQVLSDSLREKMAAEVEKSVNQCFSDQVNACVAKAIDEFDLESKIRRLLDSQIENFANRAAQRLVEERFKQAMKAISA